MVNWWTLCMRIFSRQHDERAAELVEGWDVLHVHRTFVDFSESMTCWLRIWCSVKSISVVFSEWVLRGNVKRGVRSDGSEVRSWSGPGRIGLGTRRSTLIHGHNHEHVNFVNFKLIAQHTEVQRASKKLVADCGQLDGPIFVLRHAACEEKPKRHWGKPESCAAAARQRQFYGTEQCPCRSQRKFTNALDDDWTGSLRGNAKEGPHAGAENVLPVA